VNVASRLEGQARPGFLALPRELYDLLDPAPPVAGTRTVTARGRHLPIDLVELSSD